MSECDLEASTVRRPSPTAVGVARGGGLDNSVLCLSGTR